MEMVEASVNQSDKSDIGVCGLTVSSPSASPGFAICVDRVALAINGRQPGDVNCQDWETWVNWVNWTTWVNFAEVNPYFYGMEPN